MVVVMYSRADRESGQVGDLPESDSKAQDFLVSFTSNTVSLAFQCSVTADPGQPTRESGIRCLPCMVNAWGESGSLTEPLPCTTLLP